MGKTLLRAHLIRRKPRRSLPCRRFCSCCGADSFKTRLKSAKCFLKEQETRKREPGFGKALKGSGSCSVEVNPTKNSQKSVCKFSQGYSSVRVLLKQVTVSITRLSQSVLDVLSENGSICVCRYSTEGTCSLSPTSKSQKNSCLVTPTRRLRSTLVRPFVRKNVMDSLRELNSDWRSTTCPLNVNLSVSSEASDNIQEPEFTMKTLFLENLSICKKTACDEGSKENVRMSQNENRPSLLNRGQTIQHLKNSSIPMPSQGKVHFVPYQTLKSFSSLTSESPSQPTPSKDVPVATKQFIPRRTNAASASAPVPMMKCRSLLGDPPTKERLAMKSPNGRCVRQNFHSLLDPISDNRTQLPPELLLRKRGATVANVVPCYPTPLKPPLQSVTPRKSDPMPKRLEINSKQHDRNKIEAARKSSEESSKNAPSTSRLNSAAQDAVGVNCLQPVTPRKSKLKPKILGIKSNQIRRNITQAASKPSIEKCVSKNASSISKTNPATQGEKARGNRRKQSLETRPVSFKRTHVTANPGGKDFNKPSVDDSSSPSKKQKINAKTSVSSNSTVSSNPHGSKQESSDVPMPKKRQEIGHMYTIVLSDSSEDEHNTEKSSAKPIAGKDKSVEEKLTPVHRFAHKKPIGKAAFKTIPLKSSSNDISKSSVNQSRTPLAANNGPERRNSLRNKSSRSLSQKTKEAIRILQVSDSESDELSSDSVDSTPRYVSRTGRLIGVSSGCRSCPGCKIDVPHKEKPKPKPPRKKRKPERKLLRPDDDRIVSKRDWVVAHAGSKKPVEEWSRQPDSPPTAIINGLTSSDSSDEEFIGLLKRVKVAVVVMPENGAMDPEDRLPRDGVSEEATKASNMPSSVTVNAGNPARAISELQQDSEGPNHDGSTPDYNLSDGDISVRLFQDSAKAVTDDADHPVNHIFQASENEVPETLEDTVTDREPPKLANLPGNRVYPDSTVEDDTRSKRSSDARIAASSELQETQNPSKQRACIKMVDNEVAELANLVHLAPKVENTPDIQGDANHCDSSGKLLLHEINPERSEGDISYQNAESEPQHNGQSKDRVSDPLLADNSSETSDSSAIENFDFNEYSECESPCSSLASFMPEGSAQGIIGVPEVGELHDNNNCNVSACVGDKSLLFNSQPLPEDDLPREEAVSKAFELSECVPESPSHALKNNIDGNDPFTIQNELASDSQNCQEDLASDLPGLVLPNSGIEISSETWDHLSDSSVDLPVPGDDKKLQEVHPSKRSDVHNEDVFRESLNVPQNTSPLDETASEGKTRLYEDGHSAQEGSSVTHEVSKRLPEPLKDPPYLTVHPSQEDDISEALNSLRGGCGREDDTLQDIVTRENSSQDESASLRDKVMFDNQPSLGGCNTTAPEVNLLHDSQEEARMPGTILQNDATDYQRFRGKQNVLEILLLEGCPSCQREPKPEESSCPGDDRASQDSSVRKPSECLDSITNNQHCPESSFLRDASESGADSKAQEGRFYRAISNLLINCLKNEVEVVKIDNREVIIKKVNHESAENAPNMDPVAQEASGGAEDLVSIVQELNLSVSLNPRLTIKKLPYIPEESNSFFGTICASQNSQDLELYSEKGGSEDHQVPESSCASSTRPTKSQYERKEYPTPIKRLDPRVLSVIKYNDLEIYNDEPSLNDPPKSDRLECISSKGIRFELNPEELANIENFLNDFQDKSAQSSASAEAAATRLEFDDLVIYNDEPPLNTAPIKHLKSPPLLENGEDLEDLVIDNDAPALNEPPEANTDCIPSANDSDCMVISSDDEVVMNVETRVDSPHREVISGAKIVHDAPSEPISKPRKKLFRKKRNSQTPLRPPSIVNLQRSQMEFREEAPHECFGARNHQALDLSELDCPSSDIIDEIVIDASGVETSHQPSWKPLPPFQSWREVLHQPQVFSHQGQPILRLDGFGHFSGHNPATAKSSEDTTSSSKNVLCTSSVTFDLSKTFQVPPETERLNISNDDTLTASECGDEVVVISPPKKSPTTSLNGNLFTYKNGCDTKGVAVVHNVDTDSDDDVIIMNSPDKRHPVNTHLRNFPAPVPPSPAERIDLCARERQIGVVQPNLIIPKNLPAQLPSAQVRSIRTASGNSYYVLVVPPNNPRLNNLVVNPPLPR